LRTEDVVDDALYRRYVEALRRYGEPGEDASPGAAVDYCRSCGEHSTFRLDAAGSWYECVRCGAHA
jgi:hypothetical protein